MVEQTIPPLTESPSRGDPDAARLAVLRLLEQRPDMSQRELSEALSLSLGKAHYVLHSLLDKGLVKAGNFRRSDNKLAYAYVLTPRGLREKLRLTRAFLSRKEAEFEQLRHTIASLKDELVLGVKLGSQLKQPHSKHQEVPEIPEVANSGPLAGNMKP
jgi:EPS-associated MarR family transcriptional regulator